MTTTTIALHKPYGVLSRFTPDGSANAPLSSLSPRLPQDVYPVGRLDADSEGLLVLSSDKSLVDRLLSPKRAHAKTYLAQVERVPDDAALAKLRAGDVVIEGKHALPAVSARIIDVSELPVPAERVPPIRYRKSVATTWLELVIVEGRNRQVRKMTASAGHPTLRLVRSAIGALRLVDLALAPGAWRALAPDEIERLLAAPASTTMPRK